MPQSLLWLNLAVDAVPILLVLCLLVFVSIHERRKRPRHWSHWVGAGVWGVAGFVKVTRYVAAYLLGEL
jgi:hypothetical protein